MRTDSADVAALEAVPIRRTAPDDALLLVAWLNALVSEMALRQLLFRRFDMALGDGWLEAMAWRASLDWAQWTRACASGR